MWLSIRKMRFWTAILPLVLLGLLFLLANSGREIAAILQSRVELCLEMLIPSLFACMAAANLFQQSGAAEVLGGRLCRLFRWSAPLTGVFLLSQLAGYPVGAVLLRKLCADGKLSLQTAKRMSAVCFGSGPSFAVGLTGAQLFGSAAVGWGLWLCCLLANLCAVLVLYPNENSRTEVPPKNIVCRLDAEILTASVSDTMRSLYGICGIVLLFGIVEWLLDAGGILHLFGNVCACVGIPPHQSTAFCAALLDVTQFVRFCRSGVSAWAAVPCAAGLLSFGGVCVLMQCKAVGGEIVSVGKLFLTRFFVGILAAGFSAVLLLICDNTIAVSTFSVPTRAFSVASPLPSLLIFFTGFPLILKKD
ncbi:MAG: hypothetical protein MJ062_06020 [Oscillospiraceae bacterium]|nr:hypothetical protein [Oscillospiraceae bacterium]